MVSKGDPGKIADARKLMTAGMIGLVIIVSAYAISDFVIKQLTTIAPESPSGSSLVNNDDDDDDDDDNDDNTPENGGGGITQNGGGNGGGNTPDNTTATLLDNDNKGESNQSCDISKTNKNNFDLFEEIIKYKDTYTQHTLYSNSKYIKYGDISTILLSGSIPTGATSCDIYSTNISGCPTRIVTSTPLTNIPPTKDEHLTTLTSSKGEKDNILVFICYNDSNEVVYAAQTNFTPENYTYTDCDTIHNPIIENLAIINSDNITVIQTGEDYKFNIRNTSGNLGNSFEGVTYKIYSINTGNEKTACLVTDKNIIKASEGDNGSYNANENIQANIISEIKSNSSTKTYYALFYKDTNLVTAITIDASSLNQVIQQ